MCGRYVADSQFIQEYHRYLHDFIDAMKRSGEESRFNIAPSDPSFIRCWSDEQTVIASAKWGFIPYWEKSETGGRKPINARSETAHTTSMFRDAFNRRRCVIVGTGYYEWQKLADRGKQAFHIHLPDNRPFFFYGLWDTWKQVDTFAILTTSAADGIAEIHDRMPCLINVDTDDEMAIESWLDPQFENVDHLRGLLKPYEADELVATPVGHYVNSVRNQGPECVRPTSPKSPPRQRDLFS